MHEELPSTAPLAAPEPWVDSAVVAKHIGFCPRKVSQMVKAGQIPGRAVRNGARVFWRFKLSLVDAAMMQLDDE